MIPTSHMPHQRRKKAPFYPKTVLHITQLIWSIAAFLPVCMKEKCVVDIQVHCLQLVSDWGNFIVDGKGMIFTITMQDNSQKEKDKDRMCYSQ